MDWIGEYASSTAEISSAGENRNIQVYDTTHTCMYKLYGYIKLIGTNSRMHRSILIKNIKRRTNHIHIRIVSEVSDSKLILEWLNRYIEYSDTILSSFDSQQVDMYIYKYV
jgi:hypothetical protein